MEGIFREFWDAYGMGILYTVITAIASFIGLAIKKVYTKFINDQTKRNVAKTCVNAVEQLYKDLHGEEKYNKCVEAMVSMLGEKGIQITELEIKMLIEAAVREINKSITIEEITESEPEQVE